MKYKHSPQSFFNLLGKEIIFSDKRSKAMPEINVKGTLTGIRLNEVEIRKNNNVTKWYPLISNDIEFNLTPIRKYEEPLDEELDDDIYTIEEWENVVNEGFINNNDGSGYWVKDGFKSNDEAFSTRRLDATHVTWYNK